jgi:pentatricopeptide repeat protein
MASANLKILNNLRKVADSIEDFRLAVRLKAAIACITREKADIVSALERAREHGSHRSVTAEALAIIVKVLAQAGRFDEARKIVEEMTGLDTYWHAEACIALARFSGNKNDTAKAELAISGIHSRELRNQARIDLKNALQEHRHPKFQPFTPYLKELSELLFQLDAFSAVDAVRSNANSAYLHAMADHIIDWIFANALR